MVVNYGNFHLLFSQASLTKAMKSYAYILFCSDKHKSTIIRDSEEVAINNYATMQILEWSTTYTFAMGTSPELIF